ncbi:diflavin oxidoreductase [Terriglobus aquaticus]|uniref:Sulfite reductase flavoprotein subunit alpha n=1 Tax=Terriglobus aquaticus TaxID=940139 RepID=A0ABW9KGA1_9BACT|nr:flavodoxin domain-containing protein [Terriglobus aquaticus]
MSTVPYIPDNAPFNPEQRAWLNGFLAGIFSNPPASAVAAPAVASLKFGVYFASQSGTAERLAKKLAKELKLQGHIAEVASLAKIKPADLAQQENALLLLSTYGEGDPPESAVAFRDALFSDSAPELKTLRYSVFALGDSHYEHFCKFGIDMDERLQSLGATRFVPAAVSDVDVDAPFAQWVADLKPHLSHKPAESNVAIQNNATGHVLAGDTPAAPPAAEQPHLFTRENPYFSELRERRALTRDVSSKLTMHLSLALDNPQMHYQPGDACGVIAENDPALVDEILSLVPFADSSSVDLPKLGSMAVREALLRHLQPTRLSRKIVQHFADRTGAKELTTLLLPEEAGQLDRFMWDRGIIDLLHAYPGAITAAAELAGMLPRLAPRLYSISSSPAAHGREVHCTIAVVRYRSHNRERGGIASTMLADRVDLGAKLPIYIQPNKKFRLPAADVPMIMVGPGTGIAPFRSFLHERQALGHKGRNWLFFGERSAATDFLYCEELRSMTDSGHLTRLDTAFSRDQAHKIYVQDRMIEHGAELWRWLQDGAQLYVCGDASRMAKDVDAALHTVVEQHGAMDAEAAKDFVSQLHDDRRYHRDVY